MTYEQFRAWVYRVWAAAGLLLLLYGVVGDQEWAVWTAALGQLFPTSLAVANSDTRPQPRHRLEDS